MATKNITATPATIVVAPNREAALVAAARRDLAAHRREAAEYCRRAGVPTA